MLLVPSYEQSLGIFSELEKVGDLLYYDGPLLSLFKNARKQHFLFSWVDSDDFTNRWLVWKVDDGNLYNYFIQELSLRDLVEATNDDFIFAVDIDEDANYRSVTPLQLWSLPSGYLPNEGTFYKVPLPDFASIFVNEYETRNTLYRIIQRKNALTFNIRPIHKQYLDAVSAADAGAFLQKLSKSLSSFIEESFYASFKDSIQSNTTYQKELAKVREMLAPRLYDLRYGSFEIVIGVDLIHKLGLQDFGAWQRNIITNFKNDVVDVDYNDPEDLKIIAEKYSEEAREKIYEPYIKIINNPELTLTVKDTDQKVIREYRKVEKDKEDIILPPKKKDVEDIPKEKKLFNFVVELKEGQEVLDLGKKAFRSGLLLSQQLDDLNLVLEEVIFEGSIYHFNPGIEYRLRLKNSRYSLFVPVLELFFEDEDKDRIYVRFVNEIGRLARAFKDLEETDSVRVFFEERI